MGGGAIRRHSNHTMWVITVPHAPPVTYITPSYTSNHSDLPHPVQETRVIYTDQEVAMLISKIYVCMHGCRSNLLPVTSQMRSHNDDNIKVLDWTEHTHLL